MWWAGETALVLCLSIRIRITHSRFLPGSPVRLAGIRAPIVWERVHLRPSGSLSRYTVLLDGSDCRWQGWFFMWMNGRACVTTVQMHFPYLHHKWNSAGTLSWSADLPALCRNAAAARWVFDGTAVSAAWWRSSGSRLRRWVNWLIHANVKASEEAKDGRLRQDEILQWDFRKGFWPFSCCGHTNANSIF